MTNTFPYPMPGPLGPKIWLSNVVSQIVLPDWKSTAYTFAARSWKYTTPSEMTGLPVPPPHSDVPLSEEVQASPRFFTLPELMAEPTAARVLP